MSEGESILSTGWVQCSLTDIAAKRSLVKPSDFYEGDFPYIDMGAIDNVNQAIRDIESRAVSKAPSRARKLVKSGDILFSTVRLYLKNIALAKPQHDNFIASTAFAVLVPRLPELSEYIFRYVCWQKSVQKLSEFQVGNSPPSMSEKDLYEYKIPLPPLAEQSRIVDKVDELFSSIEAGERAIARARTALTRYRKAVLKAAVTGELTADWRAKNPPSETAQELLARILKARYSAWEKAELEKLDAKGKARPETDKQWEKFRARYKVPVEPITDGLSKLPEGWVWSTVERSLAIEPNALVDGPFGSKLKREHYRKEGLRVIRLQNIGDGFFIDKKSYIDPEHGKTLWRHNIKSGDIAIASLGENLPRVCIVPPSFGEGVVKADCLKCRPHPDIGAPYTKFWFESPVLRDRVSSKIKGVGRARLNLGDLRQFPLPLAPMQEIAEIVSRVEQALSKADKAEATLSAQAKQAKALKQAVLKTAFEGRLVPQDPKDEPASELLKRIKAAS